MADVHLALHIQSLTSRVEWSLFPAIASPIPLPGLPDPASERMCLSPAGTRCFRMGWYSMGSSSSEEKGGGGSRGGICRYETEERRERGCDQDVK